MKFIAASDLEPEVALVEKEYLPVHHVGGHTPPIKARTHDNEWVSHTFELDTEAMVTIMSKGSISSSNHD